MQNAQTQNPQAKEVQLKKQAPLPSKIDLGEVVGIFLISIGLSVLSTIYPSWKASKIEPANILRYE